MGKKMAKENRHSYSSGDETSSSGQIANNSDSVSSLKWNHVKPNIFLNFPA